MRPAVLGWWLFAGGCFVGYPPVSVAEGDTGILLPDPPCDAASIEPDDGDAEGHVSQFGAALGTTRTFCGRIDEASNDGQSYTGDLDTALVHTLEPGQLWLVLSWDDGRTDLDVVLATAVDEVVLGDDGVVDRQVPAGFYQVLIAGTTGPPTDYQLDVWLE